MNAMRPECYDLILCDPPYDLKKGTSKGGFMGKTWDGTGVAFKVETWKAALRVLKPGGHLVAFGGTRTFHRMMVAIEDAGFELRDTLMWQYGTGFPKSMNVSKAVQALQTGGSCSMSDQRKAAMGEKYEPSAAVGHTRNGSEHAMNCRRASPPPITAEITNDAKLWAGYGTALKPSFEIIVWAMKPLESNFAQNALKHGVAGINVDAGRIASGPSVGGSGSGATALGQSSGWNAHNNRTVEIDRSMSQGRFPANLILGCACEGDKHEPGCACAMLDAQSGQLSQCGGPKKTTHDTGMFGIGQPGRIYQETDRGAARFFYCAKASRSEREAGLDGLPATDNATAINQTRPVCNVCGCGTIVAGPGKVMSCGHTDIRFEPSVNDKHGELRKVRNHHPCVKPLALMRYLLRLFDTPTGGKVLDPFCGSGSTGVACAQLGRKFKGIDQSKEYCRIARARIAHVNPPTVEPKRRIEL
jgi:site-specific DNA-methyltransferase (adenine-specific)